MELELNKDLLITDLSKLEEDTNYYIMFFNVTPTRNYSDITECYSGIFNMTQHNGIFKYTSFKSSSIYDKNVTYRENLMIFINQNINQNINKRVKDLDNIMVRPFISELPSSISEEYSHSYFVINNPLLTCCNIFEISNNTAYILK